MLATWITRQLVFNGIVTGLVIGLLAMGIVLVYRSTRVINFAVGNLGLPGAALLALMLLNYGFPYWVGLPLVLLLGAAIGGVVELTVVRRLFDAPRVILLVATVGVAQLMRAVIAAYPDADAAGERFPVPIGSAWEDVLGLRITGPQLTIILVVPAVAAGLGLGLNRTAFGKAVAASADNPDLARLSGVDPRTVSTFVWVVAGLLSTLSIVLLSGQGGSVTGLESLGPLTLGRALVAAVIAGMWSFPRAVVAGVGIGVAEALLRFNSLSEPGLTDFVLLVAVLVAVYLQSRSRQEGEAFAFTPKTTAVPERLRHLWWVRNLPRGVLAAGLATAIVLPLIVSLSARHFLYASIICFAICAASVTVITGWAGQLSLSQMTFAGLGALTAAALDRGIELDVGWRSTRLVDFEAGGLPFFVAIALATLVGAGLAALIGLGALRVRGLLLAVSTFVLALAAQQYLYHRPFFTAGAPGSVPFRRGTLFGLDLSSQRRYYYVCLGALVVTLAVLARLRASGVGRSTVAVRDNPEGAAAYTVSPTRVKLSAFALAGGIAALGGALLGGLVQNVPVSDRFFQVEDSLNVVAMVVIGGLGTLIGPVLGALWVIGLPAFFPDNELVPLFTSSLGLLAVIMYLPGGFAELGYRARDRLLAWAERRLDPAVPSPPTAPISAVVGRRPDRTQPDLVMAARDVTVRFGGNLAVSGASIRLRRDEIVGLIGTNGAGKSTLMNAIGGFVRSDGQIELLGTDVSRTSAAARARHGLGRTFQAATLFPELTVRETVQVALEARGRTSFAATTLALPRATALERRRRAEASELVDFLGLGRHADRYISELSTGTRRIVSLAGLLALDARVLCLDEPTAGLAQRETEAFAPLIVSIREHLGAAVVVIEHDTTLIMGISDRMYCLESGRVIAEGDPDTVRNDPGVIAHYLGTDDRTR